jgi:hypothetical protein
MLREAHHPAIERHLRMDGQIEIGRASPALAIVVAAVDRDRRAPSQHASGIGGVDHERPDLDPLVGEAGSLEGRAVIGRAIDAVGGPGEDNAWIARVHKHGERFQVLQHILPI